MTGPDPRPVNLRIIANQTTVANLMLAGEVNMAQVNGADEADWTAPAGPLCHAAAPLGETCFNQEHGPPHPDPQVRQALTTGST